MIPVESGWALLLLLFVFTLVTGPRRSLSLTLSDTRVYEPQIRARLGTTAHPSACVLTAELLRLAYRGTIINTPLLGPYRRPMPRVQWGS